MEPSDEPAAYACRVTFRTQTEAYSLASMIKQLQELQHLALAGASAGLIIDALEDSRVVPDTLSDDIRTLAKVGEVPLLQLTALRYNSPLVAELLALGPVLGGTVAAMWAVRMIPHFIEEMAEARIRWNQSTVHSAASEVVRTYLSGPDGVPLAGTVFFAEDAIKALKEIETATAYTLTAEELAALDNEAPPAK